MLRRFIFLIKIILKFLKKLLTESKSWCIISLVFSRTVCASGSVGGARPCQGRGRGFESRLALQKKMRVGWKTNSYFFVSTSAHEPMQTCMGSESTLRSGPRRTEVHWTSCAPSRAKFVCLQFCTQLYPLTTRLTTEQLQRFTNQFISILFRQWIVYVAESGGKFRVSQ